MGKKKRHINIFGTTLCIPKGYKVGKGYELIECKAPKSKTEEKVVKRDIEKIREDILELFKEHGDRFPEEEEFKTWLKKKRVLEKKE